MVQVETSGGILEGQLINNEFGGKYYSFKGVPYAEPPVADLRFKTSIPVKTWDGVRNAFECGPICYQRDRSRGGVISGSEDCLYINVYSPDVKPKNPLPVMVWFHGGGFFWGSGNDSMYGPEFLVRHGVILVTVNYRLGALGFLCLNTEDIPGNAGMKDQVLALKWIKRNIGNFGGDSNNVTIFGESAGGASVAFHLVSPMSKGLFKRAIAQSGCSLNFWATTFEPREKALKLARQLEFFSEDEQELNDFFKNLPLEKLLDVIVPVQIATKPYEFEFAIVSENQFGDNERFFYGDIYDALRSGIHECVDVMTGYTEDEGLLAFVRAKGKGNCLYKISNDFLEFFVPKPIALGSPIKVQLEVGKAIKKHYFTTSSNSKDNVDGLLRYLNMDIVVHGLMTWARFCASTKSNKVYLYKFTCKSERNVCANAFGVGEIITDRTTVCHIDDTMYLFPMKIMFKDIDQNSEAFKLINNLTTLWTNFAKYGNPTPDKELGVEWHPFSIQEQKYLDIGNVLKASCSPDKEDIGLWDGIYKKHFPEFLV